MSLLESFDAGVAHQLGQYSDAVRVPAGWDQIHVSGTPGLAPDGSLPGTFIDEATQAWENVAAILSRAGASLSDIVSVRQWLTKPSDIATYLAIRSQFIHHEPASMLAVVAGLVRPDFTVEIEVVAARPAADA